jgi:hypothetical protein
MGRIREVHNFLFNSTVYQYKRVPCGFKNSLSTFVRGLNLVSVGDPKSRIVFCVEVVQVHARMWRIFGYLDIVYGARSRYYRVAKC